jgi:Mce-associated membrane protein
VSVETRKETHAATEPDDAELIDETIDQAAPDVTETQDADSGTTGDALQDACSDDAATADANDGEPQGLKRIKWSRVVAFGVLPVLALLLAAAAVFAKWQDASSRISHVASIESVAAAKESTVALLSYQADSVDKDLSAARDRLTGKFKDAYTQLTRDVVIPGSKKDHIAAVATVPAAASVSATAQHAVVLVFVDQTVTVGTEAPSQSSSTVRVTLEKSGNHWLISAFDPV